MSSNDKELEELRIRVEKLESQMVYFLRTLGITTQEAPKIPASANVIELIRKGDKNGAIRSFREETGASLKDAKTFIESLQ
jgi:ribosomal protein L7/L12